MEKSNVIDALTKVLVTLYEEPDRPDKPVEFIKKALGGPSQSGVLRDSVTATFFFWLMSSDYEALKQENEELKATVARLQAQLGQTTQDE